MFKMTINYPLNSHGIRRMATRSDVAEVLRKAYPETKHPLYHCNARYFSIEVNGHPFTVLQSYSTNVALYSERTGTLYVLDRYSPTTTQHVWKFARYIGAVRLTRLFRSSVPYIEEVVKSAYTISIKLTAKQWRDIESIDYVGVIEHL